MGCGLLLCALLSLKEGMGLSHLARSSMRSGLRSLEIHNLLCILKLDRLWISGRSVPAIPMMNGVTGGRVRNWSFNNLGSGLPTGGA